MEKSLNVWYTTNSSVAHPMSDGRDIFATYRDTILLPHSFRYAPLDIFMHYKCKYSVFLIFDVLGSEKGSYCCGSYKGTYTPKQVL